MRSLGALFADVMKSGSIVELARLACMGRLVPTGENRPPLWTPQCGGRCASCVARASLREACAAGEALAPSRVVGGGR